MKVHKGRYDDLGKIKETKEMREEHGFRVLK